MSWADIGDLVTATLVSAGGTSAVIWLAVKLSANSIASALSKKYEAKLEKEVEEYKTRLNKKEYVSKARFDAEFEIYRLLSKRFFEVYVLVNQIAPCGQIVVCQDEEAQKERRNKQWEQAYNSCVDAQNVLHENAPFIPEQIYEGYSAILNDLKEQVIYISEHPEIKVEDVPREISDKTHDIGLSLKILNSKIHTLLSNYEII